MYVYPVLLILLRCVTSGPLSRSERQAPEEQSECPPFSKCVPRSWCMLDRFVTYQHSGSNGVSNSSPNVNPLVEQDQGDTHQHDEFSCGRDDRTLVCCADAAVLEQSVRQSSDPEVTLSGQQNPPSLAYLQPQENIFSQGVTRGFQRQIPSLPEFDNSVDQRQQSIDTSEHQFVLPTGEIFTGTNQELSNYLSQIPELPSLSGVDEFSSATSFVDSSEGFRVPPNPPFIVSSGFTDATSFVDSSEGFRVPPNAQFIASSGFTDSNQVPNGPQDLNQGSDSLSVNPQRPQTVRIDQISQQPSLTPVRHPNPGQRPDVSFEASQNSGFASAGQIPFRGSTNQQGQGFGALNSGGITRGTSNLGPGFIPSGVNPAPQGFIPFGVNPAPQRFIPVNPNIGANPAPQRFIPVNPNIGANDPNPQDGPPVQNHPVFPLGQSQHTVNAQENVQTFSGPRVIPFQVTSALNSGQNYPAQIIQNHPFQGGANVDFDLAAADGQVPTVPEDLRSLLFETSQGFSQFNPAFSQTRPSTQGFNQFNQAFDLQTQPSNQGFNPSFGSQTRRQLNTQVNNQLNVIPTPGFNFQGGETRRGLNPNFVNTFTNVEPLRPPSATFEQRPLGGSNSDRKNVVQIDSAQIPLGPSNVFQQGGFRGLVFQGLRGLQNLHQQGGIGGSSNIFPDNVQNENILAQQGFDNSRILPTPEVPLTSLPGPLPPGPLPPIDVRRKVNRAFNQQPYYGIGPPEGYGFHEGHHGQYGPFGGYRQGYHGNGHYGYKPHFAHGSYGFGGLNRFGLSGFGGFLDGAHPLYTDYYDPAYRGSHFSPHARHIIRKYIHHGYCGIQPDFSELLDSHHHHDPILPYSRIASGYDKDSGVAGYGQYPWHVAIMVKAYTHGWKHICGGTLIGDPFYPRFVLTAAHCIHGKKPYDLLVRLGDWDLYSHYGEYFPPVDRRVAEMHVHYGFLPSYYAYDLAILELARPVHLQFTPHIGVACLPDKKMDEHIVKCSVAGWGYDSYKPKSNVHHLKAVGLDMVPDDVCETELQETVLGEDFALAPGQFCATGEHGEDTCLGDGGSGVVCLVVKEDPDVPDADEHHSPSYSHKPHGPKCYKPGCPKWVLIGVTSYGLYCGEEKVPGVYMKVEDHLDWIKKIIYRQDGYGHNLHHSPHYYH